MKSPLTRQGSIFYNGSDFKIKTMEEGGKLEGEWRRYQDKKDSQPPTDDPWTQTMRDLVFARDAEFRWKMGLKSEKRIGSSNRSGYGNSDGVKKPGHHTEDDFRGRVVQSPHRARKNPYNE